MYFIFNETVWKTDCNTYLKIMKMKVHTTLVLIAQYCITVEVGSLLRIVKTVTLSNLQAVTF
jgi:hypothetical protein